jgi:GT2 family glycosyltransferase
MPVISVVTPTIRPEGLAHVARGLKEQTFKDFEWLVDVNYTGEVDFNRAMNRLVRRSTGELIVSIQDYITVTPNTLQTLLEAHRARPAFYTAPVYKEGKADWRAKGVGERSWLEWEIDLGSAPRQALCDIGGFDEELDQYWGFDNVNVGLRAHMAGYPIICINTVEGHAVDHDAQQEHPFRAKRNPDHHNARLDEIRRGLRLQYLP